MQQPSWVLGLERELYKNNLLLSYFKRILTVTRVSFADQEYSQFKTNTMLSLS